MLTCSSYDFLQGIWLFLKHIFSQIIIQQWFITPPSNPCSPCNPCNPSDPGKDHHDNWQQQTIQLNDMHFREYHVTGLDTITKLESRSQLFVQNKQFIEIDKILTFQRSSHIKSKQNKTKQNKIK
jgi:hypothetical protein